MLCLKDNLELVHRYVNGEKELKDKIVEENTPLVRSLVNRYHCRQEEKEDLFQIGCIGLLKALDNFDPSYSVAFSTYAVPIILGEIKRYFRDGGLIKVSRGLKELSIKANKYKNDYYTEFGEEISLSELALKLEISEYDLVLAMESSYLPSSMENPIFEKDGSSITLEETISDEQKTSIIDLLTLEDGINILNKKEKLFIKLRYYAYLNQQEIAQKFNVSQVQISRIEKKIIEKLRKCF